MYKSKLSSILALLLPFMLLAIGGAISRIPITSIKGGTQGRVPYDDGAKGAWLATGTANQVMTTGGSSANPAWANIVSLLTAGTGLTLSGTTNATLSLSTPVSTSNGGTGSSLSSPAQGSLLYANSSNVFTALAPGTSGYVLQTQGAGANPQWVASSSAPGGASTDVQFNSSGAFGGDAGFTYGGQGGSTLMRLTPTSTSATALAYSLPASFAGNVASATDSSSNPVWQILFGATGEAIGELFASTSFSTTTQADFRMGGNGYPANNNVIGMLSGGTYTSGAWTASGYAEFFASQAQSSGNLGTDLIIGLCPNNSGTIKQFYRFDHGGNAILNNTGSAVATNATNGFVYLPNCAGTPTGTPTAHTGSTATIYDTTDNVVWHYNGSQWNPTQTGSTDSVSTTATVPASASFVVVGGIGLSGAAYTITLPGVGFYNGRQLNFAVGAGAPSFAATISPASGNIYNGGTTVATLKLGASGTFTKYVDLESDGTNWYIVGGA